MSHLVSCHKNHTHSQWINNAKKEDRWWTTNQFRVIKYILKVEFFLHIEIVWTTDTIRSDLIHGNGRKKDLSIFKFFCQETDGVCVEKTADRKALVQWWWRWWNPSIENLRCYFASVQFAIVNFQCSTVRWHMTRWVDRSLISLRGWCNDTMTKSHWTHKSMQKPIWIVNVCLFLANNRICADFFIAFAWKFYFKNWRSMIKFRHLKYEWWKLQPRTKWTCSCVYLSFEYYY